MPIPREVHVLAGARRPAAALPHLGWALLCAGAIAQSPAPLDAPAFAVAGGACLQRVDGDWLAAGARWKATFADGAFEFTPALGGGAPRNFPFHYRLAAAGRGADLVPVAAAAPLAVDGLRAERDRGAVVERWDARAGGIEQSFVFTKLPPGGGELVLRAALRTELTMTAEGEGLRCEAPGIGGFTVGGVTGVDAAGRRAPGSLRLVRGAGGDVLEYTLPAAFVDEAALPLVLDPFLGSAYSVSSTVQSDQAPVVAYDQTSASYLAVWTMVVSAVDNDVMAQRFTFGGTALGPLIAVEASLAREFEPSVANVNLRNAFVVTHTRGSDVWARTVHAQTGALSSPLAIATGTNSQHQCTVGGQPAETATANCVCIWRDGALNAIRSAVLSVAADSTPTIGAGPFTLVTALLPVDRPRISRSCGPTGRYGAVCQIENSAGANSDPLFFVVGSNGQLLSNVSTVSNSAFDQEYPAVDGDGTNWTIAWQTRVSASDVDVHAVGASYSPLTGTVLYNGPIVAIEADPGVDERQPSVTWLGETCLVGFIEQVAPGSSNWDSYASSVNLFSCAVCEGQFTVSATPTFDGTPQGIGTRAGGTPLSADDALVVFVVDDASFVGNVFGRRWLSRDGSITWLGGDCGAGGSQYTPCAVLGNTSFMAGLRDSIPNATSLFLVSTVRADLVCGGCRVVPDPYSGFVIPRTNNAQGAAGVGMAIPPDPGLRNVAFYVQWLTVDLASPSCVRFGGDFSPARRLFVQ